MTNQKKKKRAPRRAGLHIVIVSFILSSFVIAAIWYALIEVNSLVGSEWQLVSLDGEAVETVRTLHFYDDTEYTGYDGCNTFTGQFIIVGDTLSMTQESSTLALCPENEIGDVYRAAIKASHKYKLQDNQLILTYSDGQVLRFVQR